jgi:acyl-coenzyme A thioesterase PaaI-like protein
MSDSMNQTATPQPAYRVAFVERTGLERLETGRGYARLLMPLAGNENHVGVMYMGAYTVLAEAVAAIPGISILDTKRFFPILKDIAVAFHRSAASDVTAEFRLDEEELERLLADLERKGSATYLAEFPMHDAGGTHVATGRVTVKLLSHGWTPKAA